MVMIAVLDLDIDPCLGHPPRNLSKLTRLALTESLHEDVPLFDDADSNRFERPASRARVGEEEMGHTDAVDDEDPSTFDAHSDSAQRLAHLRKRPRAVLQGDGQVLHSVLFVLDTQPGAESVVCRRMRFNCAAWCWTWRML